MKPRTLTFALALASTAALARQPAPVSSLQTQIRAAVAESQGQVSVSCSLPGVKLDCDLNPHAHPPMQSVFKLPLGLAVLDAVEHQRFGDHTTSLDQPIHFAPADREPGLYSSLQEKYPAAGVDLPLHELLRLSVSLSDNVATDLLLRLLGGPAVVEHYLHSLGIAAFQLRDDENTMQHNDTLQYRNWWEPASAVDLLRRLNDHSPLTPADTVLIMQWMRDAPNKTRIKGLLPATVEVLQKTGTSGQLASGLAPASNDIGLITLPDGRRLALAVFVTDSHAPEAVRDHVIAQITLAIWQAVGGR